MQKLRLLAIPLLVIIFIAGYIGVHTDRQTTQVGKLILNQDRINIMEITKESTEQSCVTVLGSSKLSTLISKIKEIPVKRLSVREEANFLPERLQDDSFLSVSFYINNNRQFPDGHFLIWPDGYICIVDANSMKGNQRTISYLSISKYPEIYDWLNKNL